MAELKDSEQIIEEQEEMIEQLLDEYCKRIELEQKIYNQKVLIDELVETLEYAHAKLEEHWYGKDIDDMQKLIKKAKEEE